MRKFQQIISGVLHPLLLPLFGTILLFQMGGFSELPLDYQLYVEGIVFLNMAIIPALGIWLLKKSGHVSDLDVSNRSERVFPYLIVLISEVSACYLLYRAQMPWWIIKLFMGSIVASIAAFLITLKWKISAHTTAFGCLIAATFLVLLNQATESLLVFSAMILLAGVQASSRLYLKAHTLSQVFFGFLLGLVSVGAAFFLIP
jgi:membrane-associated phospholipid phosphatase